MATSTGVVKWFKDELGYGFIRPDDGTADVFVHYSGIVADGPGRRNLDEGDRVSYETSTNAKGVKAENVSVLDG